MVQCKAVPADGAVPAAIGGANNRRLCVIPYYLLISSTCSYSLSTSGGSCQQCIPPNTPSTMHTLPITTITGASTYTWTCALGTQATRSYSYEWVSNHAWKQVITGRS